MQFGKHADNRKSKAGGIISWQFQYDYVTASTNRQAREYGGDSLFGFLPPILLIDLVLLIPTSPHSQSCNDLTRCTIRTAGRWSPTRRAWRATFASIMMPAEHFLCHCRGHLPSQAACLLLWG